MESNLFTFPVGYHSFHKEQLYNFQLNRWYSLGYLSFDDVMAAGKKIRKFADWAPIMLEFADKKLTNNQFFESAFYYRAAEFYMLHGHDGKEELYDKFIELFYNHLPLKDIIQDSIPYSDSFLSVLRLPHQGNEKKGIILMHGGFDSFIEEFISMAWYFTTSGYEVIAFEGPGQGKTLKKFNLPFDYEWEKPVKIILDFYKINEAALLGISMGGYLCLRAAAFEPRIKWVISTGGAYDYYKIPSIISQWIMSFFKKYLRSASNKVSKRMIEKGGMDGWQVSNIMYITRIDVSMDASEYAWEMNKTNLHPELINQDVMLITGKDDHFIPFKLHAPMIKSLTNVKSITDIVYTKAENASNHCSIGNIKLSLDTMIDWLNEKIIENKACTQNFI